MKQATILILSILAITTEEGLRMIPDYSFKNSPKLEVLFVPSAYDMYSQIHNSKIIEFIIKKK